MSRHTRPYRSQARIVLAVSLLLAAGCGVLPKGNTTVDVSAKDFGIASWYGEDFHGRLAADGRPFDMYALTAAHRSLPLGSVVRVLNVRNGQSVHVRITDRGPYVAGRMLDLSQAAAAQLGMVRQGLSPVVLEVVGEGRFAEQWVVHKGNLSGESLLVAIPSARPSTLDEPHHPYRRGSPVRQPEDLWRQPRQRRVADVFAANYHVDRRVAVLMMA